jgi:hypothetical protein
VTILKKPSYKEMPHLALRTLPPPYPDYAYFEGHELFPFEFSSNTFSPTNAWWLAEVSTLVYAKPDFVLPRLQKIGLKVVRFVETGSTQCFVAANDRFAMVGFRGSEVSEENGEIDFNALSSDVMTDADFWMSDWESGGKVHRGFKKALDDIWKDLSAALETLRARGCSIWMTGHSLGAALATLAADRFQQTHAVYTFGSPRVGNTVFSKHYRARCYRIVHSRDIVARIPPPIFYRHVGEIRMIGAHADLAEPFTAIDSGLIPNAIFDHVPLFYAVLLWNRLVAARSDG